MINEIKEDTIVRNVNVQPRVNDKKRNKKSKCYTLTQNQSNINGTSKLGIT